MINKNWILAAKIIGWAAGLYSAALGSVWLSQEKLLFKPDPFSRIGQSLRALRGGRSQGRRVREWVYKAPDGISIQGFISLPEDLVESGPLPSVIYLGGIREESSWALEHAHQFGARAFVCLNYRGYGLSEGQPAQAKILDDCHKAIDWLCSGGHLDPAQIHLIGRSLGSVVAGYLCGKIGASKACLVTPYDSVLSVAKKKFWYLPVEWIFRHPFDALPWARSNSCPMLMLLAEVDETVPHAHSRNLFGEWAGPKSQATLPGTDHSSIVRHPDFFPSIADFFFSEKKLARKTP